MNNKTSIELGSFNHVARCHLVVLGAGASRACCLNGDQNGRMLPLMNELLSCTGLNTILADSGYKDVSDFEAFYSELKTENKNKLLISKIESAIYEYFSILMIPDEPTIYDYLLLCLRNKDVIATFNWDPLLHQALLRCLNYKSLDEMPKIFYLHGNVAIGVCYNDKVLGNIGNKCSQCNNFLKPMPLLYPVLKKDYNKNPLIAANWDIVERAFQNAFAITIFGYSAPTTDVEAREIFTKGLQKNTLKEFAQLEIIDIRNSDELNASWGEFYELMKLHYQTSNEFWNSLISNKPRRTCEALWQTYMENKFLPDNKVPKVLYLEELVDFLQPLFDEETEYDIAKRD